jgi:hypothetical protein
LYEKVLDGDWPDSVKEIVGKRYYHNAVEPLKLSPEELKAREDAKWRAQREDQDKKAQTDAMIRENQARVAKAMGEIKAFIGEAMKEADLPSIDTPEGAEICRRVADVMRLAHSQQRAITPKEAIEHVKGNFRNFHSAYYERLVDREDGGQALITQLGEKVVGAVQKYLLKKAQEHNPKPPTMPNGKPAVRSGERKTNNLDDLHEYLEERKRNG